MELQVDYPTGGAVRLHASFECESTVGNGSSAATMRPRQEAELLRLLERG